MEYSNGVILLLVFLWSTTSSCSIVKTLPGFDGNLPFKLETGYVGVGETEDVELFYYFVESQSNPPNDPLLAWLNGGPGCSTFVAFFYANGPLSFDSNYDGKLPTLKLNPYTWTKFLNVLFIDSPVGTGFSYSKRSQGYYSDDQKAAADIYEFLQKWLIDHPNFAKNRLYVGGGSYSGIPTPVIVQKIYDGNEVGRKPFMNIKGYVLGSPKTDSYLDANARVQFAHRLTLISDELYESAKTSCNGDYIDIDPRNEECRTDVAAINELLSGIYFPQVLLPACTTGSNSRKPDTTNYYTDDGDQRIFMKTSKNFLQEFWCRDHKFSIVGIWANDPTVQEALHIREGTKRYWKLCNSSLAYTMNIPSTIDYHRNLTNTNLRALIYTSDHDLEVPHIATQEWIRSLNLTLDYPWRPWFIDAQVVG
ncbi:hypothetical protein FH972_009903 [Carpinus fangiana]|uniref:Serine carboxypeptidase-like 18 n=1 Tax=Carpinus fangiana TaxID=176857 RepID=A0A660KLN9_9ROSI|nr:hypothetical protein FH972_009903 [Carpinus fangiana]